MMNIKIRPLLAVALIVAAAPFSKAADYTVDFEGTGETKTAYPSGTVALGGISWNLTEVLIGTETGDWKLGLRAARLRGYTASAMTMQADKAGGAGTVSFSYRCYGTDAQIAWAVEISSNGGSSWAQVGADFTGNETARTFSETVNIPGSVRIRIIAKGIGSTNKRLNIDNIGITDYSSGPDTTPPVISTLAPANNETNVPLDSILSLTFDEAVAIGTGNLRVFAEGNAVPVETIAVADAVVSGALVIFGPLATFTVATTYHIELDAGALKDLSGNGCAGFSGGATWKFTTAPPDITAPIVSAVSPAHGATAVPLNQVLTVTFNEPVFVGTGDILIKNAADHSELATLAVSDGSRVMISNSKASLILPAWLPANVTVYVEIPANAFKDGSDNPTAAYGGSGVWSFSTMVAPSLTAAGPYTQNFSGFASATDLDDACPLLPEGWLASSFDLTYDGNFGAGTAAGFRGNDHVLGYQHTADSGTTTATLMLRNATGTTLTELWISYLGRVARATQTRHPAWTVSFNQAEVPALGYSTSSGTDETKTHLLSGLSIAPGATFTLAWKSDRGSNTGTARQIGVTDVYVGLSAPTSGFTGWATTHCPGETPAQDHDGDGLDNGVEYFMGTAGNAFTQAPGIVGGKLTWPMNPAATGVSYRVLTSPDLDQWSPATTGVSTAGGNLIYQPPATATKLFIRLEVTVQ